MIVIEVILPLLVSSRKFAFDLAGIVITCIIGSNDEGLMNLTYISYMIQ
jgi:hypothetical protein